MKEVILMSDVEGLGSQGDMVKVSEGHARNFLLPKNLAAPVTEAARRKLEKLRSKQADDMKEAMANAEGIIAMLQTASVTIPVKTGEGGKMFGSVTNADIAKVLAAQGIKIDRHLIVLEEPIRETGVFTVAVKVVKDQTAPLKIWVVEE